MFLEQQFILMETQSTKTATGGTEEVLIDRGVITGFLDLLTGTYQDTAGAKSFTEDSTHVLVTIRHQEGIEAGQMIKDIAGRFYEITYSDDPVGVSHHNELYVKFLKEPPALEVLPFE